MRDDEYFFGQRNKAPIHGDLMDVFRWALNVFGSILMVLGMLTIAGVFSIDPVFKKILTSETVKLGGECPNTLPEIVNPEESSGPGIVKQGSPVGPLENDKAVRLKDAR